jgi:hypothetical protein
MGIPGREIRALATAADPDFKETEYGFQEFTELLNFAADKGLLRVESDPNRGLRFYAGADLQQVLEKSKRPPKPRDSRPAGPPPQARGGETGDSASRLRGRRRRRRNGHPLSGALGGGNGRAVPPARPPAVEKVEKADTSPRPAPAVDAKAKPESMTGDEEAKVKRPRRKVARKASARSRKTEDDGSDTPDPGESS